MSQLIGVERGRGRGWLSYRVERSRGGGPQAHEQCVAMSRRRADVAKRKDGAIGRRCRVGMAGESTRRNGLVAAEES